MARKHASKNKTPEADPLGDLMTPEFVEQAFKEAVTEARTRLKKNGQDIYYAEGGKIFAEKPDGTVVPVVFNPKRNNR
jgi:hypothetical protein